MSPAVDLFELKCFRDLLDELTEYDSIGMSGDKLEDFLVKLAKLVGVKTLLSHYDTHISWLMIDVFDYVTHDLAYNIKKGNAIFQVHPICDINEESEKFIMRKWKTIRLLA